jgi:hypothetical protein
MVHHYREEEERGRDEPVKFNCEIKPMCSEPEPEPKLDPEVAKPEPELVRAVPQKTHCPLPTPPTFAAMETHSDIVEALPTILVGIGLAYAVGMLTGAFLFSPAE